MERNVLLAVFLSFLVIYAFQALVMRPAPSPTGTTPRSAGGETASAAVPAPGAPQPYAASGSDASRITPSSASAEVGDPVERDITVETSTVRAVLTNRGARLKSWQLKHYSDEAGRPLDLVPTRLPPNHPLPFSLRVDDESTAATLNSALFALKTPPPAGPIPAATELEFEYRDASGLRATKRFGFEPAGYVVVFTATAGRGDATLPTTVDWGPGLGDDGSLASGQYSVRPRGLLLARGETKTNRLAPADIAKQPALQGEFQYAGVDDHYFMSTALQTGAVTVSYQPLSLPSGNADTAARELMAYSVGPVAGTPVKFYVGPKDYDALRSVGTDLVRAIDFGIFSIVVVPLLGALKQIYNYVGNYGWAIILLTVAINALMFPLRHKQVVSARRMQEIQPEMKRIQDRYAHLKATDPAKQKMNQELWALYSEKGANPASGCVPMLLTMPVLFAFYALLTTAIELRGAPFFGWIQDLSRPDPYYVVPILMGVTQFWQMRMTPQTGIDPAQQKMMMFMPIMFMFFFLWAPSGVVLYWLISNIWMIGQQYLTNYLIGPPAVRAARPAAERRVKQTGSGKTEAATRES